LSSSHRGGTVLIPSLGGVELQCQECRLQIQRVAAGTAACTASSLVTLRELENVFRESPQRITTLRYGVGRGKGVGRGRGVTLGVALGVAVGVTVGVAVGVTVAVGVGVGVGVGPAAQKISIEATGMPVLS